METGEGVFAAEVDDEFMRTMRGEYYPDEGRTGLSIRQLQNIMRSTIAHSDGRKVTVSVFLHQLERIITEGPSVHHWLSLNGHNKKGRPPVSPRLIDIVPLEEGEGDFGDYCGLVKVVRALYYMLIAKEITVATVDRDPKRIEIDLRKYLQHTLLARARENHLYIIAANRGGEERGARFFGRSQICGPEGEILAEAAADVADVIYADIDPSASRERNLVLKPGEFELRLLEDRRPELYGAVSEPRPAGNRIHQGAERSKT